MDEAQRIAKRKKIMEIVRSTMQQQAELRLPRATVFVTHDDAYGMYFALERNGLRVFLEEEVEPSGLT